MGNFRGVSFFGNVFLLKKLLPYVLICWSCLLHMQNNCLGVFFFFISQAPDFLSLSILECHLVFRAFQVFKLGRHISIRKCLHLVLIVSLYFL